LVTSMEKNYSKHY